MQKICIVNFTGFRQNWGCQATSWELLKWINDAFPKLAQPHFSYVPLLPVVDIDEQLNEQLHDIYAAINSVAEGCPEASNAARYLEQICLERYGFWAQEVKDADYVFFQGEGTLMGGGQFHYGARFLLLPFVAKMIWKKPVVSLNQTVFVCDEALKSAVVRAYNCFDANLIRESVSFQFARDIGIKNLCFVPDAAFLTVPSSHELLPSLDDERKYFCITGTAYRQPQRLDLIFEIADQIKAETGLVPLVAASKDVRIEQLAANRWSSDEYVLIPQTVPYQAVAWALNRCRFLLGGRYHMAIIAATVGTPAILLKGNTFKNEGLAAALKSSWPVHDAAHKNAVLEQARSIVANFDQEHARLMQYVSNLRSVLHRATAELAAWADGQAIDPARFAEPQLAEMPADLVAMYCHAATHGIGKGKLPVAATDEERLGTLATLAEHIEPLAAGLDDDFTRCASAIRQSVQSRQGEVASLPVPLQRVVERSLASTH